MTACGTYGHAPVYRPTWQRPLDASRPPLPADHRPAGKPGHRDWDSGGPWFSLGKPDREDADKSRDPQELWRAGAVAAGRGSPIPPAKRSVLAEISIAQVTAAAPVAHPGR